MGKSRKKRNKLQLSKKAVEYIRYALIAIVLLVIVIEIKCCVAKNQPETEQSFEMEFDQSVLITYYNTYNEAYETTALDEYLFHVVAAEMPASYGFEALKAQAVAARTYTISHMTEYMGDSARKCGSHSCALCTSSSCCQAWKSYEALKRLWGRNYNKYCQKIYNAVMETKDLIITYDSKPIDAMFHASSGGHTENSENVYPNSLPYLRGVDSPGEEQFERVKNTTSYSYKELSDKLNDELGCKLTKSNIKKKIKIKSRYRSGQVESITIDGKDYRGKDIRKALGLKSCNFDIEFTGRKVIITTYGYGHGVGMSQAGAAAMAAEGKSFREILLHYYTDVEIG